jgi:hypothetical protein
MKKLPLTFILILLLSVSAYAEEISFNCKFINWVEYKPMDEIIKTKKDLSPDITMDKQITFEKVSDSKIFVLKTSFIPAIKDKIEVSFVDDDLIFSFRENENFITHFFLNRVSGEFIKRVKRFDEKISVFYDCKKANNLI